MPKALSEGEQKAEKLAGLARGTLKNMYAELVESLEGHVSEHHQWVLMDATAFAQAGRVSGGRDCGLRPAVACPTRAPNDHRTIRHQT